MDKTPDQRSIQADDEERAAFLRSSPRGTRTPSLAVMKEALAATGDAGLEPGPGRPSRKGTAKHMLDLLLPEEAPEASASGSDNEE